MFSSKVLVKANLRSCGKLKPNTTKLYEAMIWCTSCRYLVNVAS